MKLLVALPLVVAFVGHNAFGQGAQADQIKRRAKELSHQNNVRQGVAPPSQPAAKQPGAPTAAPAAAKPAVPTPATIQQQNIARLTAHLAALKPGAAATPEQKQKLIKDMAGAVRGATKPSLPTVTKFVNSLNELLLEKGLGAAEQSRFAQNIEAVLNAERLPAAQFDAIIADVQAILQVGGAKRNLAVNVANDLKSVGAEVRKTAAR
jgi:hypothetical protein